MHYFMLRLSMKIIKIRILISTKCNRCLHKESFLACSPFLAQTNLLQTRDLYKHVFTLCNRFIALLLNDNMKRWKNKDFTKSPLLNGLM